MLHENNCHDTSSAKNARPKSGPSQGSLFGVSAAAPGPRKPSMPGSFWLIRSTTRSNDGIACVNSERACLAALCARTCARPGGPVSAGGSPWGVPKRPFWHPRFAKDDARSTTAPARFHLKPSMAPLRTCQPPGYSNTRSGESAVVGALGSGPGGPPPAAESAPQEAPEGSGWCS